MPDELLVHVAELLGTGRAAVETYLDAVAADAAEHLRPRLRAAVLVEERLLAEDHDHLVGEAVALGLDKRRAAAVVSGLAAEQQASDAEYRARCPGTDGRWRVVGRTRHTVLEDGGAPGGPVRSTR